MKETLGESMPAHSTVTTRYDEFKRGGSSCEDSHRQQLLSANKLLKKLTNVSWMTDDSLLSLLVLIVHVRFCQRMYWWNDVRWVPRMISDV